MPGFNGRGPQGLGPMTGGARGFCNQANAGSPSRLTGGMGFQRGFRGDGNCSMRGMRRGLGRGYGNYSFNNGPYPLDDKAELEMLKAEAEMMKQNMEAIDRRIVEIGKISTETNE